MVKGFKLICQTIAERIVEKVDPEMKAQVIHWAAYYVSLSVR